MPRRPVALVATLVALLGGCASPVDEDGVVRPGSGPAVAPERFTIVPDDYHVPYAGTAEDGRKFFLSDELFDFGAGDEPGSGYVGLFLWNADGSFAEVRVDDVSRPEGLPPGQAASGDADDVVQSRLAELGDYELEPITVEPFLTKVDGVDFGWRITEYEGTFSINIEPGNFIAYYEPWDGVDYDT